MKKVKIIGCDANPYSWIKDHIGETFLVVTNGNMYQLYNPVYDRHVGMTHRGFIHKSDTVEVKGFFNFNYLKRHKLKKST